MPELEGKKTVYYNFKKGVLVILLFTTIIIAMLVFFDLNYLLGFLLTICSAVFYNPIFWVSVLGPFIQSFHFLWLRSKLGIGYKAKEVGKLPDDLQSEENEIEDLRKALNENKLAYAFSDFNTQLFVTSVAFIFLTVNVFTIVSRFYIKSCGTIVQEVLFHDVHTLLILITFIIIFVLGIYILLSGKLISHKVLFYYKPTGDITGETRWPPMQSGLTWFRIGITIYSVCYTYWVNQKVPHLMEYMNIK